MASAHLGFCMECYSIYYYDNEDSMRTASPKETTPTGAFLDVAVDHGLVFPPTDTTDKTYRRALGKLH